MIKNIKNTLSILILALFLPFMAFVNSAIAAGGYSINVSTSGSAIADGSTALNITVYVDSGSSYMVTGYPICISASGSGNTLSATSGATTNAYVYFTLKSSVAETKILTVTDCGSKTVSKSVTFSTPAVVEPPKTPTSEQSSTKKQSTSTATTKPSSTQTSTEPAPSVKTIEQNQITINGQNLSELKDKITVSEGEAIKFSGKTGPNYVVTVYVFSEPKKYTVTADSSGNWQLEVTGLPAGDHHAEAELTDPATNTTSQRTKLLDFAVKGASTEAASASSTVAKADSSKLPLVISTGIIGLILLGAATLLVLRRFKPELFNRLKSSLTSKFHKTTPPTLPSV